MHQTRERGGGSVAHLKVAWQSRARYHAPLRVRLRRWGATTDAWDVLIGMVGGMALAGIIFVLCMWALS